MNGWAIIALHLGTPIRDQDGTVYLQHRTLAEFEAESLNAKMVSDGDDSRYEAKEWPRSEVP